MRQKINETESNNIRTVAITSFSTKELVDTIHIEDIKAYEAVGCAIDSISRVVDRIFNNFSEGGRVIYVGAGTSGRLGAQDAVEMWPTYGLGKDKFDFIIAGGEKALTNAVEGAEDSPEDAIKSLKALNLRKIDTVIGISASGSTPYVIGAINYANEVGCYTVGITNNSNTLLHEVAKDTIFLNTGSEVIQGSTRMKAGTSQKMTLNIISTSLAVRYGRTYNNMMFHMKSFYNEKLRKRAINLIVQRFRIGEDEAKRILEKNGYDITIATRELEKKSGEKT